MWYPRNPRHEGIVVVCISIYIGGISKKLQYNPSYPNSCAYRSLFHCPLRLSKVVSAPRASMKLMVTVRTVAEIRAADRRSGLQCGARNSVLELGTEGLGPICALKGCDCFTSTIRGRT